MTIAQWTMFFNAIQSIGTAATPLVVAWLGAKFIYHQTIHEAVLSEKAKHYNIICPFINKIYAYRLRRGDFLNQTPESILDAKRAADHEFWSFFYIWSDEFKSIYLAFIKDCFDEFQGAGYKALINVDPKKHPIKPKPTTTNADNTPWSGFSGKAINEQNLAAFYLQLMKSISKDIGTG